MRPVQRGTNPTGTDYDDYRDAFPHLVGRLGNYCSYCERLIEAPLAVEHIQPKGLPQFEHLEGTWDNFLLGCVNCNSTKKDKDVRLDHYYFPDRDNTFAAFEYTQDGLVKPAAHLTPVQQQIAMDTLGLTGLDKKMSQVYDENGKLVVLERMSKRMQLWLLAVDSSDDLTANPTDALRRQIVRTAKESGGFSIWMKVFENDFDMRQRFINAFPGTATDCFNANTQPVSPRPDNGLAHAGKI